jgi:multiple antibiotic resistance protein
MHVPSSLLSSFVTLFVTIGPTETAVIFAGVSSGLHHKERRTLAIRSVALAPGRKRPQAAQGYVVHFLCRR